MQVHINHSPNDHVTLAYHTKRYDHTVTVVSCNTETFPTDAFNYASVENVSLLQSATVSLVMTFGMTC
jgi:hypothetical protein